MKVLSNQPVLPAWQLAETVVIHHRALKPAPLPQVMEQGNPMSVLPDEVQESLRAGRTVDLKDIVPVPAR